MPFDRGWTTSDLGEIRRPAVSQTEPSDERPHSVRGTANVAVVSVGAVGRLTVVGGMLGIKKRVRFADIILTLPGLRANHHATRRSPPGIAIAASAGRD
jgi:hypothetical protein